MRTVAPSGSGQLLERDEALSRLADLFADVRSDSSGSIVWVGGEAGVGKTALLRRFCHLHDGHCRVAWGACEPLLTPRPLGPFIDIADEIGGELSELVMAAARPYRVAAALLEALRGRRPTVLVLDDLHWADEATLDVVTLLAARIASAPALLLASYRDDELDRVPALRVVLGELAPGPSRLKVKPLSEAAVATLAEPSGLDAGGLYARTGGNPFYVTEVLATGGERLPVTVRDAVLARVARLSEQARRLLEAAAVVPGPVELWLLQELGGPLAGHVDECLASGVLTAGRAHVAFRHELSRVAVEEAIPPHRRLGLHRAALAALARTDPPDLARLAHHAEATGDLEQVLRWAPLAAREAAGSGAHREAAAQYARVLRFSRDAGGERAEFLERRAEECYLTSQLDEAIIAQQEALECRRLLGDRRGEGNALRVLSRLLFFAGRASEGEPLVVEAIERLERLPAGRELAMAYANASQRRMVVQDFDEALAWGNRALRLARELRDFEVEVYALTNIAAAEFRVDADVGGPKLIHVLKLAQRHALEAHVARIVSLLVMFGVWARRFDIAARHLDAGLEYCTERGLDTWRLYLLACRARMELDLGRWDDAAGSAAMVLRDPRGAHLARGWALAVLGRLRARRGDAEAIPPLEEASRMVNPTAELDQISQVAAARAEAAWLAGDPDRVRQATEAALALARDRPERWAVGELAYWRWRAGVHDELPAEVAEPYGLSIAGDWQGAADRWRAIGCPYEAALALADADDETALRRATAELQALGARPAAAIVARRLRERGVRRVPRGPRPSTRQNPAGLTARELEVLALVADGLRNAEIAERLVLSGKTVDHHVSAILRKLDARSRAEAAAAAARLGLTGR